MKTINNFRQFLLELMNVNNPLNSKIFVGLVLLFMIIVLTIISFFIQINMEIFYSIIALCAACFGLSTITKSENKEL